MWTGANPTAPPLILLHGGRDHCRNWDWVAQDLRRDYHIIAPDLRGHGDSAYSPSGDYSMSAFVYDLAQLIHQQHLAPVRIVAIRWAATSRCATPAPSREPWQAGGDRGMGPSPAMIAERSAQPLERMRTGWPTPARSRPHPAPLRLDRGGVRADAGGEQAPDARAGALPDRPRRQPERGRHLQLEVRQLHPLVLAGGLHAGGTAAAVGQHRLPGALGERQGELGLEPRTRRPRRHFKDVRVVEFENAGHWVHHDRLDAFLAEVRAFL
jgi:pimeloyl-ACP methyl ester carboxylesterase